MIKNSCLEVEYLNFDRNCFTHHGMLVPYVLRIVYNYKGILFYNYFITIDVSVFLETVFQFPSDVNNEDRDSRKKTIL